MNYPVCLDLAGKSVLVVGGGTVAARKVRALQKAKAKVSVVAPEFIATFKQLKCQQSQRNFQVGDLKNIWLVIAATDDKELNSRIAKLANTKRIFVNVVDCPVLCTFTLPAVARSGHLTIAISTGGQSPLLAAKLKKLIQPNLKEFSSLTRELGKLRTKVQSKLATPTKRKQFWQQILKKLDD